MSQPNPPQQWPPQPGWPPQSAPGTPPWPPQSGMVPQPGVPAPGWPPQPGAPDPAWAAHPQPGTAEPVTQPANAPQPEPTKVLPEETAILPEAATPPPQADEAGTDAAAPQPAADTAAAAPEPADTPTPDVAAGTVSPAADAVTPAAMPAVAPASGSAFQTAAPATPSWGEQPAPGAPTAAPTPWAGAPGAPEVAGWPGGQPAQPGFDPAYGQPYPGAPMGAPYPGVPAAPPRKANVKLIALIGVLVVLLLAGGGFAYWYVAVRDDPSKPVSAGQAKTPQAAVRGYLQALANGDATDALSFLSTRPTDTTFLTNDVLSAGNSQGAISDIKATKASDGSVNVTYNIGSQGVTAHFAVHKSGKYYTIDQGTQKVNLSDVYADGVGMTLNGVALDSSPSSTVTLFPGSYQLGVTNSLLTLTGGDFTVTDPAGSTTLPDTKLTLADNAQAKFADAVKKKLDGCLAEKMMLTTCGFGIYYAAGVTVDPNSVGWRLMKGQTTVSKGKFTYDGSVAPSETRASISLQVKLEFSGTDKTPYFSLFNILGVSIDFSDENNLAISFDALNVTKKT